MARIYPWQERLLESIVSGGIKPSEMTITMSGRQTGKSYWTNVAIKRLMDDLNSNPIQDLMLSQGNVYGSQYHCVEPVGGNWMEMEMWCLDTYGNCGSAWDKDKAPEPNARWYMNDRKFWFRNQKDRDWFIVKWRS